MPDPERKLPDFEKRIKSLEQCMDAQYEETKQIKSQISALKRQMDALQHARRAP